VIPIAPSDVHIWWLHLDLEPGDPEKNRGLLSAEEQARAGRFHFARDRRRFVCGRALVRTLLSQYLGEDPARIPLRVSPSGKPFLAGSDFHFNLSHCEDRGVLAIASRPVGVDLEKLRNVPEALAIAERLFTDSENRALRGFSVQRRSEAFLRCWTRKEAYVKARGGGLATTPLDAFEVSLERGSSRLILKEQAEEDWALYDVEAGSEWVGSLAVELGSARLVHRVWPPRS
jgi:4'-phosphopantetheinyl transferase